MTASEDNQGNPYAPPSSDLNLGTIPPLREGELAERGTRLVAQMLDGLLALLALLPGMLEGFRSGAFRDSSNLAFFRNFGASGAGMFSGIAWIGLLLLQAYLVTIRGQSLAKGWLGIKIVKVDGSPVKFVSGVLLRHWLVLALQYVPRRAIRAPDGTSTNVQQRRLPLAAFTHPNQKPAADDGAM
jgi:uncharacterized RDD family membrane protein YckC